MSTLPTDQEGATVVITHRVQAGREAAYEAWLGEIGPLCRAAPGHLDWHVVRPIAGLTTTFTVIVRFAMVAQLRTWMESAERRRLIEQARPLLATDDRYTIKSGLDFWFTPPAPGTKVPVRWKQFLVSWSAIFPLVLVVPLAVVPALRFLGLPEHRALITLCVTGTVVALMVYVVMPRYTRLVQRWLYR